jgi:hypothetical protein
VRGPTSTCRSASVCSDSRSACGISRRAGGRRRSRTLAHDDDIRHALRNVVAVADDPGHDDVTLFLGRDRAGNLVEVGVLVLEEGPLIIHAMAARTHRFRPDKE